MINTHGNGHFTNRVAACDLIIGLGADTIVPGHGPVCDKEPPGLFHGTAELAAPLGEQRIGEEA